jgi:hypothetical protein
VKHCLILTASLLSFAVAASATTANCTVTSGTVLTSSQGGLGYSIFSANGTSTGGATGVISCPAISVGFGVINNYQVMAEIGYNFGPFGTSKGTQVDQTLTLLGGSLNGSSSTQSVFGGASPLSTSYSPELNFQIGSTLSGATSYSAFTVNVNSVVAEGGPVGNSTGRVFISYDVSNSVPEPSSFALIGIGIVAGELARRMIRR